jgi:hypothetical protein
MCRPSNLAGTPLKAMDPKTTALLTKIVALFDSPNDGERSNAFTKAQDLLEKHGQSMADVLEALTTLGVRTPVLTDFIDRAQGHDPAAKASDQAAPGKTEHHARAARPQDQAESLADVIARHGSVQAVLQPCAWEALLRSGVRRGSTFHVPPNERWTRSIYGYTSEQPNGPARDRAVQAIARAYPLPTNLQDALAEHAHWERRDRELRLVLGPEGNTSRLDLTAQLRWELVRNLIRSELPVRGEAEFQIRLQFWIDERPEEIDRATLDEVKHLAEMVGRDLRGAIVQSGNATSVLFARWVCDVVVPTLQLPDRGRARSNLTFDAMLRNAMRDALTEIEPQRPGQGPSVPPGP